MRGLGIAAMPQLSASQINQTVTPTILSDVARSTLSKAMGTEVGAPAAAPGAMADPECQCLVNAVAHHMATREGVTMGEAELSTLLVQCANDKEAFKHGMKLAGISFEVCKPWYARRVTLAVGAGIGAFLLWKMVFK